MKLPNAHAIDDYCKEWIRWSTEQRISWCIGLVAMALGRGDIRAAMHSITERPMRAMYDVGYNQAIEDMKSMNSKGEK